MKKYKYFREEVVVEKGWKISIPKLVRDQLQIKIHDILILEMMDNKTYLGKKN
jgi:bifunctional DNA-binding transcriptional regulator/antitoxin component of YhaV-PrlF toxin-antitoxin module